MARARGVASPEVWGTVLAGGLGIGLILWLGHRGWDHWTPNEQIAENRYFCEALRTGLVRQPANTWSNLGFLVVAVVIAGWVGRRRGAPCSGPSNLMTRGAVVPRLYVGLVAFLGVGSMCLHASLTRWGGLVDVSSMLQFITFVAAYAIARLVRLEGRRLVQLFAACAAGIEVLYLAVPSIGIQMFGALIGVSVLAELAHACTRTTRRKTRWLVATAASFLTGLAIWVPSQNGRALCAPSSLLQGHAVWHVLCAAAVGFLFLYFRSERAEPERVADSAS